MDDDTPAILTDYGQKFNPQVQLVIERNWIIDRHAHRCKEKIKKNGNDWRRKRGRSKE
jgi:hypothetical protein